MSDRTLFVGPLDRVLYLRTIPALDGLAATHLAAIAQHAQEVFFPKGALLVRPDTPPDAVYVLVDGKVSVTRHGRPAPPAQPGDAVGLLHLLARVEAGLEARAIEDTIALALDWDAQLDVSEQHFAILERYLRFLGRRTAELLRQHPARMTMLGSRTGGRGPAPATASLHLIERTLALRGIGPFFAGAPDAVVELAQHVEEVRFQAGHTLWRRRDRADDFLVLHEGAVQLRGPGRDGQLTVRDGGLLGYSEAVGRTPRWYELESVAEGRALRVGLTPFLDILEDHFDLATAVLSAMAERLIRLVEEPPPAPPVT